MDGRLTTAQVAERLNVAQPTVKLWCRQGRFPNAKLEETPRGPVWQIPESDLADFEPPKMGRPSTKSKADGAAKQKRARKGKK
ncbi:MAG: helix-turn-helix domain-containing protein [Acidobacteriota bacterium]|nr:helix-turn-helix domain-containing protein [Acidobacteriota bacterium]